MLEQEGKRNHNSTPLCIIAKIFKKEFSQIDKITRAIALNTFLKYSIKLTQEELWKLIDIITGGLGYRKDNKDLFRVIQIGCLISWPEVVAPGYRVLEIGTGLGRTMYCVLASINNVRYFSIDVSPLILSIALYMNPFDVFKSTLWSRNVFLILGDAVYITRLFNIIKTNFDHIIHDGGPNPQKNPKLYSRSFLKSLVTLLRDGGTISIFAGKNPRIVDMLFKKLKDLGLRVWTESYPGVKIRVLRAEK